MKNIKNYSFLLLLTLMGIFSFSKITKSTTKKSSSANTAELFEALRSISLASATVQTNSFFAKLKNERSTICSRLDTPIKANDLVETFLVINDAFLVA